MISLPALALPISPLLAENSSSAAAGACFTKFQVSYFGDSGASNGAGTGINGNPGGPEPVTHISNQAPIILLPVRPFSHRPPQQARTEPSL